MSGDDKSHDKSERVQKEWRVGYYYTEVLKDGLYCRVTSEQKVKKRHRLFGYLEEGSSGRGTEKYKGTK